MVTEFLNDAAPGGRFGLGVPTPRGPDGLKLGLGYRLGVLFASAIGIFCLCVVWGSLNGWRVTNGMLVVIGLSFLVLVGVGEQFRFRVFEGGRRRRIFAHLYADEGLVRLDRMVLGKRKMEKPEDTAEPVEPNNFLYLVVDKRLIDVVIATPTFILSLPLIAILALLVRLQAKGPVFERFAGYGPDGKELSLVRFNTSDPADRNRKVDYYWRRNAARTPLNDFLIRSGLDRLPGLIAVIRGDFSLVGPELTTFRKEKKLYWVRPGLTSLARLNGNAHAYGLGESADEFYIRSLRFGLDLRLMVKSVQLIVSAAL